MGKKLTTEEFVKRAKKVHGDKYDYSLVKYINAHMKIEIICKEHGIFEQTPSNHLHGYECKLCSINRTKLTTNDFIKKANEIHDNKYDYSLVEYKNNRTKVKIICKKCGIFKQLPKNHLHGNGCKNCQNKKQKVFLKECINTHNNKYDYSLVKYKGAHKNIKIICKEHGIFKQSANHHRKGSGCPKCYLNSIKNANLTKFQEYRKSVNKITKTNKQKIYNLWDGHDYYDGEYIKYNINLSPGDRKYPTIDHKISVYYGFMNNISVEEISKIENLCITKRYINSSKNNKTEEEFDILNGL